MCNHICTLHPKYYARGSRFAVVWYMCILTISFKVICLALGHPYDCPGVAESHPEGYGWLDTTKWSWDHGKTKPCAYLKECTVLCHTRVIQPRWIPVYGMHAYRHVAQILQCTSTRSHSAPFGNRNVNTCAHFCYKIMHCGIFVWCILGFVWYVHMSQTCNILLIFRSSVPNKSALIDKWHIYSYFVHNRSAPLKHIQLPVRHNRIKKLQYTCKHHDVLIIIFSYEIYPVF